MAILGHDHDYDYDYDYCYGGRLYKNTACSTMRRAQRQPTHQILLLYGRGTDAYSGLK